MPQLVQLPTYTSGGLTTSVTAYTSGDQLGTEQTLTIGNLVAPGQSCYLKGALLVDMAAVLGATDVFIFSSATTPAADNAANSWSDADMAKILGVLNLTQVNASALNKTVTWSGSVPIALGGASTIMIDLVTRTGNAIFAAATDITLKLWVEIEP